MSCPFGHKELEKFAFDITKVDRIFDFLLQEGQIKLSPNHVIPSAEELKKIEQKMQEQYDIDNFFEKRRNAKSENEQGSKDLAIYKKPNILKKFLNIIKGIFNKNKF